MSEKCFQNRKKLLPDGNPLRNFIRETGGYVYQFRIDRFFENKKRLLPQKKNLRQKSRHYPKTCKLLPSVSPSII